MDSAQTAPLGGFETQLLELFLYTGTAWVLWLLIILSVVSVGIAIERMIYFVRTHQSARVFSDEFLKRYQNKDNGDVEQWLASQKNSLAYVASRAVGSLEKGPESIEEIIQAAKLEVRLELERGLAFLGTLGNNAPFIGLFGTVLGIIRAFQDLAQDVAGGSSAVMAGIAEALVATAVGLLVALPAVALFNFFQRLIRGRLVRIDAFGRRLMAELKAQG